MPEANCCSGPAQSCFPKRSQRLAPFLNAIVVLRSSNRNEINEECEFNPDGFRPKQYILTSLFLGKFNHWQTSMK